MILSGISQQVCCPSCVNASNFSKKEEKKNLCVTEGIVSDNNKKKIIQCNSYIYS